jgi:hypothetical protein
MFFMLIYQKRGEPPHIVSFLTFQNQFFMSTQSISRASLSDKQIAANRSAIHSFIAAATVKYGRGSVILLPEFEQLQDGTWVPAEGNGIRPTANNSAFCRFGKMTLNQATGKPQYIFTNHFGDSEGELANMLAFIDPTATIGSAVHGVRLVIHESLQSFSRTNPDRDIKWADQANNLKCMKLDTTTGELVNIYRRTKVFFADDEGNYPPSAVNILIAHDNVNELSEAASLKFQQQNKGNSAAIAKAARIAELQKEGRTLTAKEQGELKVLTTV